MSIQNEDDDLKTLKENIDLVQRNKAKEIRLDLYPNFFYDSLAEELEEKNQIAFARSLARYLKIHSTTKEVGKILARIGLTEYDHYYEKAIRMIDAGEFGDYLEGIVAYLGKLKNKSVFNLPSMNEYQIGTVLDPQTEKEKNLWKYNSRLAAGQIKSYLDTLDKNAKKEYLYALLRKGLDNYEIHKRKLEAGPLVDKEYHMKHARTELYKAFLGRTALERLGAEEFMLSKQGKIYKDQMPFDYNRCITKALTATPEDIDELNLMHLLSMYLKGFEGAFTIFSHNGEEVTITGRDVFEVRGWKNSFDKKDPNNAERWLDVESILNMKKGIQPPPKVKLKFRTNSDTKSIPSSN